MYQIDNDILTASFDENAGITGLFDKRLNREYITEKKEISVCRVMMPNKKWDGRFADTGKQTERIIKQEKDKLIFIFPHLVAEDDKKTDVTLTIHYQLTGDELHTFYEINNDDREEYISHVMFPIVSGITEKTLRGKLIMPEQSPFGDTREEDPFAYGDGNHKDWIRSNNRKMVRYPQLLVTSWMDYSDEKGGIWLEQRSERFDICDFGFERLIVKDRERKEKNTDCLQFALQSYPGVLWQKKKRSAPFVIGIHEKDWKIPAIRHREWLKKHIHLPQIPEGFKRALGWHFFFMKQQDGTVYFDYHDLPDMAEAAARAGLHHIMVFGWYFAGHDNEYPFGYYTNKEWGGAEILREQIRKCEEAGSFVIPFFNGTLLDISTEEYKKYGWRWPVLGRTGKPYCGTEFSRANTDMGFSNACIPTTTRNMTLLDICITAEEVRSFWKDTVKRIVEEYGFHNLQLDQIAHKAYVCYDPEHHHKSPETAYTEEAAELLAMVREIVRTQEKEGIMIGEGMTDLVMQYCDGFWNWHQAYNKPEIIRYSVPWLSYSHEVDANEYDTVNLCFAERILLDLKIEGGNGIITDYPRFCDHLKQLALLKQELGPAYIDGEYFYQDGLEITADSQVVVRMYRSREKAAIVAANTAETESECRIKTAWPFMKARILSSKEKRSVETEEEEAWKLLLRPYEVIVIEGIIAENRKERLEV
ncbi:MAG: hypothetical protein HDR23_03880 [Lachnospiraceae bacterium]|nr:hypothetical protein [Lachnospiraceae bacterium]MBD5455602.1 hypothetical protein [Lachnospiraceae bacterium]